MGRVTAAIFVAEIGDITRFADARHLCSWAGLTPSHRESDDKAHRGHITKQGSTLVRWAAVEVRRPLPRRRTHRPGVQAHPGAPGHAHRPGGGSKEIAHSGLLRAA